MQCLDSKSGIKNKKIVWIPCAHFFLHFGLAAGRALFSSCGADPSRAKNGLSAPRFWFWFWLRGGVLGTR
jgi:hypothetical protein